MHVRKVKSLTEIHQDIRYLKMYDKGVTLSTETFFLNQKLFLADYSFLDSISLHRDFVFYSPQVLFYLNHKGSLELFAILLRTNKGPRSHVMTKFSPPNKFLFAKMHVALADRPEKIPTLLGIRTLSLKSFCETQYIKFRKCCLIYNKPLCNMH